MKKFLKENWFKIIIIILVLLWVFQAGIKFYTHKDSSKYFRKCNVWTGQCYIKKVIRK